MVGVGGTLEDFLALQKAYQRHTKEMISMTEETTATVPLAITAEILVPVERITNCLIGAFEGGSTYWLHKVRYVERETEAEYENPQYSDPHFWNDGGRAVLTFDNPEEKGDEEPAHKEIGMPELTAGLSVMAAKCPRHFGDLLAENDDAITHDVFIQCVLFGDIVYG